MNVRRVAQVLLLLFVALLVFLPQPATGASPLDTWRLRNPLPGLGNHLNGISCSSSDCIAVGVGGRIITSTDGYNWTTRDSRTTDALYQAAYGNSRWVAVGDKGTIVRSTNRGVTWRVSIEGYSDVDGLRGVAFGKGSNSSTARFVAVGKSGRILSSTDGINWNYQVSGTGSQLNAVAFGNGIFIAVGSAVSGTIHPVILRSTNGTTWSEEYGSATQSFFGVTYGDGQFMVVGSMCSDTTILVSNATGTTWDWSDPKDTSTLKAVAFGSINTGPTFVAINSSGTVFTAPSKTENWVKWSSGILGYPSANSSNNVLNGITFFKKTFIVVGSDGKLMTSADGASWTERPSAASNFFNGVVFAEGKYVAVGWGGKILTSTDSRAWVERDSGTSFSLHGIAYGNGTFVAVGSQGKIVSSGDGTTWVLRTSNFTGPLFAVTYSSAAGLFVAVGSSGKILTSPNGATWTSRTSGTNSYLYAVAFGAGQFIAVGQGGKIVTSANGIAWTNRTPSAVSTYCLYGVTYGDGMYLAVGENGTVLTSPDRTTWTKKNTGVSNALRATAYVDNTYVALGSGGKILTSADASSWSSKTSNIPYSLVGIASKGNGTMVAVGTFGTILCYDTVADSWIIRSTGTYKTIKAIARGTVKGQVRYVVVGESATVLTSANGSTWDIKTIPGAGWLNGVIYGHGRFVAVGATSSNKAGVFTSTDGDTWTQQEFVKPPGFSWQIELPSGTALNGITLGDNIFVAAGEDGVVVRSTDGIEWYYYLLETCFDTKSVSYGRNTFVMVGNYNPYTRTILDSPDGIYWTMSYAPIIPQSPTTGFSGVDFGGTRFVVVGPSVKIVVSTKASPVFGWRQKALQDFTGSFDFTGISYGGSNVFAAVGTLGQILTTPDGTTWTFRKSGTTKKLYGIAYGNSSNGKTFMAVGEGGMILQSDSL
ncbi:MAG TPA: hypothetical protein PK250_04250 [Syntrophobacter fumaroxidans]|nr:hypothetical protein [Syntrophobacter fumaroxidans]